MWMRPRLEAKSGFLLPPPPPEAGAQPLAVWVSCFSFLALNSMPPVASHNVEEIRWPPTRLLCARLLALAWRPCRAAQA